MSAHGVDSGLDRRSSAGAHGRCGAAVWVRGAVLAAGAAAAFAPWPAEAHSAMHGHWTFDDGAGTTAADSAGHGNDGVLVNGATWAAGKVGGAVSLDGVDDSVDFGTSSEFSPTDAMTISAWIRPANPAVTGMVVCKYGADFQYFLRVQSSRVRFSLKTTNGVATLVSSATVAANAWAHVAGTYDGATARLYVDGTLSASSNLTGTVPDNGAPLLVGREGSRMFFGGRVDDLRIYDRSLAASEILVLRDTTAPSVAVTAPADGATVGGTVAVTASASDDTELAGVQFFLDGNPLGGEDALAPFSLDWDTTLGAGGQHTLYAVARDTAGHLTTSAAVGVTVDNFVDATAPSAPSGLVATPVTASRVDLAWSASQDDVAVAGYDVYRDGAWAGTTTSLLWSDSGLASATSYSWTVVAYDPTGNRSAASDPAVATTLPPDVSAPSLGAIAATQVTTAGATITWTTDEPANSQVEYGTTPALGTFTTLNPAPVLQHSQALGGLAPSTQYHFAVRSRDPSGNLAVSVAGTFTTSAVTNVRLHLKLDDGAGTVATDSSGLGNPGNLVNGPAWAAGQVGGALSFDGVNDLVDLGNVTAFNPVAEMTLSAWIRPANPTATGMVISKYGASYQYFVRVQAGRVRFALTTSGGAVALASTAPLTAGVWVHFAATYDGTEARLYVDGALTASANASGAITDNGAALQLGAERTRMFFAGLIDDVRLHDRALTASEVRSLFDPTAPPPDPAISGEMSPVLQTPEVAINMVLLRTGEVLCWGRSGTGAYVLDPATGASTAVPNSFTNLFCSGQSQLADGRILVIGGDDSVNGVLGENDANIFDPATRTWTSAAKMQYRRWYPTATTLGDGRVLATSGGNTSQSDIVGIPEVYDPSTNTWTQLTQANLIVPFYAYMFLLPDGRVVDAGADEAIVPTRILDIVKRSWSMVDPTLVDGGSAAMYRIGKILKSGSSESAPDSSGHVASAAAHVIDMGQTAPSWRATAPMNHARFFHTLTILPDGDVIATGGGKRTPNGDPTAAVYEPEIWSEVTESWTRMTPASVPRMYHSTALLLPDARVLISGSGFSTGPDQKNAEIFSPPYLFRGTRPAITSAPSSIAYGSSFDLTVSAPVARVTLLRPGAVTHTFDMDQRFLELDFTDTGGTLTVEAPAQSNLAPPGYYMVFVLDGSGVPSVARFVRLQ